MNSAAVLQRKDAYSICTILGHHLGDALRSPGFSQPATYLRRPRCDGGKCQCKRNCGGNSILLGVFLPGWENQPLRDKPISTSSWKNPCHPYYVGAAEVKGPPSGRCLTKECSYSLSCMYQGYPHETIKETIVIAPSQSIGNPAAPSSGSIEQVNFV